MKHFIIAASLVVVATPALANPLLVSAAAGALSGASSDSSSGAIGTGTGGDASAGAFGGGATAAGQGGSGGQSSSSMHNDSTSIGAALGQAPSAPTINCGKDTRIALGLAQWGDYSDKCFDRATAARLIDGAVQAYLAGNNDLGNLLYNAALDWTKRADKE